MEIEKKVAPTVRFGIFEADLQAGELRRSGVKVKLQEQPFQVLAALLERPGLRDRSIARGTEPNPVEAPLEISRQASYLKIYLPIGSSEGDYGVRVSGPEERILFATKGVASTQQGVTSLVVDVNLSSASPGLYFLQVRKGGSVWTSYDLRLR